MKIQQLASKRAGRFVAVGLCNAAISFGLLNLIFYNFHTSKIIASIIATSCALIFSFIMNRGFVFDDKTRHARQQLPIFVIVTISGSLVLLNLVYALSLHLLNGHEHFIIDPFKSLTSITLKKSFVDINTSTIIGAVVALFWNYNGYKRFVFKGSHKDAAEETAEHVL